MGRGLIHRRIAPFPHPSVKRRAHPVSTSVSRGCPGPVGRSPTCYSPVRRSPPRPKAGGALDLHALRTPPAFVLSQDQTLRPCPSRGCRSFRSAPSHPIALGRSRRPQGRSLLGFQRSRAWRSAIVRPIPRPVKKSTEGLFGENKRSRPTPGGSAYWWPKRESNPCYQIESLAS